MFPLSTHYRGPVAGQPFVPIYLVRYDELRAAVADGVPAIGELEALPSLRIGQAAYFVEINGLGRARDLWGVAFSGWDEIKCPWLTQARG